MLSGTIQQSRFFFSLHPKKPISDKMTLKEKCWGFHVRDDYSAERQQLVIWGSSDEENHEGNLT